LEETGVLQGVDLAATATHEEAEVMEVVVVEVMDGIVEAEAPTTATTAVVVDDTKETRTTRHHRDEVRAAFVIRPLLVKAVDQDRLEAVRMIRAAPLATEMTQSPLREGAMHMIVKRRRRLPDPHFHDLQKRLKRTLPRVSPRASESSR